MMRRKLGVLLFVIGGFASSSYSKPTAGLDWNNGIVVLNNDEMLVGKVHVDARLGLLLFKEEEKIRTFPAFKVKSIDFYDNRNRKQRKYVSLPFRSQKSNQATNLFEVILRGKFSVVRQELWRNNDNVKRENNKKIIKGGIGQFSYFVYDGSSLTKLHSFNKRIFPRILNEFNTEVKKYVKKKRLNLKNMLSRIKVIAYYNALKSEQVDAEGLSASFNHF